MRTNWNAESLLEDFSGKNNRYFLILENIFPLLENINFCPQWLYTIHHTLIFLNFSLHVVSCFCLFGCGYEPNEVPWEADRKRGPRRDNTAGVVI